MDDWDVVYSYTRAQAISDGVLIDVSELASEAGFKIPVAMTLAVYEGYIKIDLPGQDTDGRLWDVLFMLLMNAQGCNKDTILFDVLFQMDEEKQEAVKLKAIIGPGDDPSPVLTILLPYED